jgi:hypothetical protein
MKKRAFSIVDVIVKKIHCRKLSINFKLKTIKWKGDLMSNQNKLLKN